MEKLLSEMKMENEYNLTIRKEYLDIGMEYTITGLKDVTAKFGKKIVIIIDFKGEMIGLCSPRHFDAKAADLEEKSKQLNKGMILKLIERKIKII